LSIYPIFSRKRCTPHFPKFCNIFESSLIIYHVFKETLHFHIDEKVEATNEVVAQVGDSTIQVGKAKQSSDTSTIKNLLKNWQLMSAIILYCIFCLHDVAYAEVISFLYYCFKC
jgi:hypothetical protein